MDRTAIHGIQSGFRLLVFLSAGILQATETKPASDVFEAKLQTLKEEYRRGVASEILKADRVECYRLDSSVKSPTTDLTTVPDPFSSDAAIQWFPLPMFQQSCRIAASVKLDQNQMTVFTIKYREILLNPGHMLAQCYEPHHAVRIYQGERLILQADICIKCRAYCLHYPGKAGYELIPMPDASIQPLLLQLLPLPE